MDILKKHDLELNTAEVKVMVTANTKGPLHPPSFIGGASKILP